MTDDINQEETPDIPSTDAVEQDEPRPRRRHPVLRALGVFGTIFVVIIAVSIVTTVTVDLGPGLRVLAATAGGNYLKREMRIGGLSIRLLTGTFVVDDLLIGGLNPGDRPFFVAKRIEIAMPLSALVNREVLVQSVELTDWTMLVETWPNGRHSFPKFTRDTPSTGKKRFVTTVKWVHAGNGKFILEDHGAPWGTVARNLDVVVRQTGYNGRTVTVDVEDEGRIVGSEKVTLPNDGSPASVRVRATAAESGPRLFTFRVAPVEGELVPQNNVREALTIARQCRTILGANGVSLEYPVLRHANNLESVLTYEGTAEVHQLVIGQQLTGVFQRLLRADVAGRASTRTRSLHGRAAGHSRFAAGRRLRDGALAGALHR